MQELNANEIDEVAGGLLPESSVGGDVMMQFQSHDITSTPLADKIFLKTTQILSHYRYANDAIIKRVRNRHIAAGLLPEGLIFGHTGKIKLSMQGERSASPTDVQISWTGLQYRDNSMQEFSIEEIEAVSGGLMPISSVGGSTGWD